MKEREPEFFPTTDFIPLPCYSNISAWLIQRILASVGQLVHSFCCQPIITAPTQVTQPKDLFQPGAGSRVPMTVVNIR